MLRPTVARIRPRTHTSSMSWQSREGQIIGLKAKERQAAASERQTAVSIRTVIRTLHDHRNGDKDDLGAVVVWAAKELERIVSGLAPRPFGRPPGKRGVEDKEPAPHNEPIA